MRNKHKNHHPIHPKHPIWDRWADGMDVFRFRKESLMKAQYAILRFAKYKGPEIGHIEVHNERTKEKYASNCDAC